MEVTSSQTSANYNLKGATSDMLFEIQSKLKGLVTRERARGHGHKWQQGKFQPDIRKKCVTVGVVQHWNQLPTEAADTPSLEIFRTRQGPKQTDLTEVGPTLNNRLN
ncbi:hypothetical protein QYF61_009924 [Mycteria americana]|uniref:Uncharacterized protein n=1 Tax=Mycteria americana TaxID=33587 RepID=A0AAN7NRP3_MYCAM|nr:hypothetical protein QYF61_009924 [Mycteria americana]